MFTHHSLNPFRGEIILNIFFFFFTLFCFTILYWFCHTLTWISHGCTWFPNPEPPSHLPSHIISLDHPRAPAPSILYPVSNIDWWFISYLIVYMFQCHSPKSSHPLPLPQSLKVRFTFFSSAHRTFSRIDHILGHKPSLGKFKKIEIIPSIISDHNGVRLDVNYRRKTIFKNPTYAAEQHAIE